LNRNAFVWRLFWVLILSPVVMLDCGAGSFSVPPFTSYTSVVATDLNGDGRPDIAMASSYISGSPPHAGNAVVLLRDNAPSDAFLPPTRYATGHDSNFILAGDINGDGKPDLVVSNVVTSADNNGTNSISVLLQRPGSPGTFSPSSDYVTGQSPVVALGDIDGDGLPDLVVGTTRNPAGVSVFAQSRTSPGVFESPVQIASLEGVSSVAVGDIDRNGTVDVCLSTATGLVVLLQEGSVPGTFVPAIRYEAGSQPIAIAMGDLDGDGLPDLVVANYGSPDGQIHGGVSVFLQDPSTPGKLLPATEYATGSRSISVAVGDLDGDGMPDIAVANPVSSGANGDISILLQAPGRKGIFQSAVNYPASFQPLSVAVADLNGDGKADVVVADGGAIAYYQDSERPGVFMKPVRVGP
jgi:hypothetical protein